MNEFDVSSILEHFEEGQPKVLDVPYEWLPDIKLLNDYIVNYLNYGYVKNYKIQQIKEKFGSLRFYYFIEPGKHDLIPEYYSPNFWVDKISGAVELTQIKCQMEDY